jgi:membrane protein required for colicin V production
MIIDVIFMLLISLACFQGMKKGLVRSLLSFVAVFIGLAAAMKLSSTVAAYLTEAGWENRIWLPFVSFVLVMAVVFIGIQWLGKLLEKTAEVLLLGWINKLGGILIYLFVYGLLFSVMLHYGKQLHLISEATIKASHFYSYIGPLAEDVFLWIGKIIPWLKSAVSEWEGYLNSPTNKTH